VSLSLRVMQLELIWPADLPANQLRTWLREQLAQHGVPLRWAITAVEPLGAGCRQLKLEAVMTSSEQ